MNTQHYDRILEQFKMHHPYLAEGMYDWRPRGDMGIRIEMSDGKMYDFHAMSNTIRNVDNRTMHRDDTSNEEEWRVVFADRLNEYMCTKRITQQALAEYTGLGKGTINSYVNGRSTPSGYALTKLARALDCTVMDLTD